jgi:pimeloyl-ACP methyl ester carboxylesterase
MSPRRRWSGSVAFFTELGPRRPAVVGSSMGGFYGQWLARRFTFSHLFLINPALTPWELCSHRIGETMTTARGETYQITAELIERTRAYDVPDPCDGVPTTLFLDRGDEVIDYRVAESSTAPAVGSSSGTAATTPSSTWTRPSRSSEPSSWPGPSVANPQDLTAVGPLPVAAVRRRTQG